MKKAINYPRNYVCVEAFDPSDYGLPDNTKYIAMQTDSSSANITIANITNTSWVPMPFECKEIIIDERHDSLGDNQGIVEVDYGELNSGGKYVFNILKQGRDEGDVTIPGIDYIMNGENKVLIELEDEESDGCYIGYKGQPNIAEFNYRRLLDYAHSKGAKLQDLTQEEIEQFRIAQRE